MSIDLSSSAKILGYSNRLISHLSDRQLESKGKICTDHNFSRLKSLFETNTDVVCYHRPRAGKDDKTTEFMWDFLAIQSNGGILLAAESEQNHLDSTGLKHDFEKLLYVFAPVRLLLAKARTKNEAELLALSLAEYAKGTCLHFNPGSASFCILICGTTPVVFPICGRAKVSL